MYHSCLHLSSFRFLLPKINFGSNVLHIVVEPATDCCRYFGVVDTINHLFLVNIDECSCQIERVEYCSVSWFFSYEAGSNDGGDRRQCSAYRVLRPKPMLSRLERDVCQYFWQQEFFQRFDRWPQYTDGAPGLADVVVLAGF